MQLYVVGAPRPTADYQPDVFVSSSIWIAFSLVTATFVL